MKGTQKLGLTPNVVFCEGWTPVPGLNNTFFVFLGGADSVVGVGMVSVLIQP